MPKHLISGPTPFDLKIADADGSFLFGPDGKKYIDMLGGWCVSTIGWKHPRMIKALQQQPGFYLPPTMYSDFWNSYAEKLLSIVPKHLNRIFRVTSGSEAVEFALKLARAATGKKKIVSFGEVYHGHTFGAASIGSAMTEDMAPGVGEIVKLNIPNEYRNKHGVTGHKLSEKVLVEIETVFKGNDVAAFISEAVFTNVGTLIPPSDFYPKLEALCRKYDTLLIIDEVAAGFGRTGKIFAFEHWNLKPDIITLGKGLTGGYSTAGATICTEKVEAESHKIPRYSTFGWNLYDVVAMKENLNIFLDEKLWEKSKQTGEYIFALLKPLEELPQVGQIRGIGMLFSIEFVKDKSTKEPLVGMADQIAKEGIKDGVITESADSHTLFFSPALNMDRDIAKQGVDILINTIKRCLSSSESI